MRIIGRQEFVSGQIKAHLAGDPRHGGGVLGSWTGPNVVAEGGNRVRYFHTNDLGTVQAQTKADGSVEGVWEPDFFGNYGGDHYAYTGSPARPELGLTGQFYDAAVGGYMFRYRWYDPERGRWLSEDPMGYDRPNLYLFTQNSIINKLDIGGLLTVVIDISCQRNKKKPEADIYFTACCPDDLDAYLRKIAPLLEAGDTIMIIGHGSPGALHFTNCGGSEAALNYYSMEDVPPVPLEDGIDINIHACNFFADESSLTRFDKPYKNTDEGLVPWETTGEIWSGYFNGNKVSGYDDTALWDNHGRIRHQGSKRKIRRQ